MAAPLLPRDGRATNLEGAIAAHKSGDNNKYQPSEANNVIDNYFQLSQWQEQEAVPAET
jgi:hypothetical protein